MQAILPVAIGLVVLAFFLSARQSQSGLGGFGGGRRRPEPEGEERSRIRAARLQRLKVPFLWSGVFGTWGLGWLDTSMPWIVPLAAIAVFVAVGFVGSAERTGEPLSSSAPPVSRCGSSRYTCCRPATNGRGVGPAALPVPPHRAAGRAAHAHPGGRPLTPRTHPDLCDRRGARRRELRRPAHEHPPVRDRHRRRGPNLDAASEWWWVMPFGPTAMWIIGALAYGALVFLLVPRLASGRGADRGGDPGVQVPRGSSLAR